MMSVITRTGCLFGSGTSPYLVQIPSFLKAILVLVTRGSPHNKKWRNSSYTCNADDFLLLLQFLNEILFAL